MNALYITDLRRYVTGVNPARVQTESKQIARKTSVKLSAHIIWEGRRVPLERESRGHGLWRIRSRSRHLGNAIIPLGTSDLATAKSIAREKLAAAPLTARVTGTLEDVARIYPTLSLQCSAISAKTNVRRLRWVVTFGMGKTLSQVKLADLANIWPAFVAAKQDADMPDRPDKGRPNYNRKRLAHEGIRSAMKQARSVFVKRLRPQYKEHGITLPPGAEDFLMPATRLLEPAPLDDTGLIAAWETLQGTDRQKWLLVGLAYWTGMRRAEILACRGGWIVPHGEGYAVSVKDREEEGFDHKTGSVYKAPILHAEFARHLATLPKDELIVGKVTNLQYRAASKWLRQFTGAKKPVHRLRGRYADNVKKGKEEAIMAAKAGTRAAADALGHAGTAVTERHYLTPDSDALQGS